ncbi:MAG: DUF1549 domain-containing protein [Planctomycetia bacterium]|nr:DUF1549 domain-containing protein [Planctomycetia bacterium]
MSRLIVPASAVVASVAAVLFASFVGAEEAAIASNQPAATPAASADPSPLASLVFETGQAGVLRGRDAQRQLVVTGKFAAGPPRDLTRQVTYQADPAGIVTIDSTGLVTPLADGRAVVTAVGSGEVRASTEVTVEHFVDDPQVNFPNQIVPIFTKLGCNSGGCHGKASGQNGFKLSLLGFEPGEDYEHLVKEARGRRVFPAAPDRSLLLSKPINAIPHGGGQRLERDSLEYRLLKRWITHGMPYGKDSDPKVASIQMLPEQAEMHRRAEQQVAVLAHYTDGSVEDVTRLAQFDPNDGEMAECSTRGLVKTLDLTGDVAVMARYQGHVAVFRAHVPLGVKVDNLPPSKNFVDELVFSKLKTLGVPPSPLCDDATYIRRAMVDIAGRLPTLDETRQFLADSDPAKRDKLIDRVLDSGDYADYFANKWNAVLRNRRQNPNYMHGTYAFHEWIRESLYANKPYDQFVREILAASGEIGENPPVAWYREVKDVNQQVEDCAQLFLGLRIQCARCHHHPFEAWSQRDYYGFSAFFSQIARKAGNQQDEPRVYHKRGVAQATNPKTNERLKPTGLGAAPVEVSADRDPREALVDWMAAPENPFFAKALVNRYWKHFFSRGIVDPEDDMRVTNPASNPALLDALAKHFVDSRFDLKELVRAICRSNVYQLSALPNDYNLNDKQNFSRYYPKRLTAEVLLDALDSVTVSPSSFSGLPAGTRATQLPDTGVNSYFLTVFGRPEAASACECERSQEANLAQSLHLLNSGEVQGKLASTSGRAARLAAEKDRDDAGKVAELYLCVYSRPPAPDEMAVATAHLQKNENKQQAYEDILWALVNTKEFLFNH